MDGAVCIVGWDIYAWGWRNTNTNLDTNTNTNVDTNTNMDTNTNVDTNTNTNVVVLRVGT